MTGTYLFDTNLVIQFLGRKVDLTERAKKGVKAYIPFIVLGELYFGALKSKQPGKNLEKVEFIRNSFSILYADNVTPRVYGEIKRELSARRRPIPENDIWIAAIARQHNLTVVTGDKHFDEIQGITTVDW